MKRHDPGKGLLARIVRMRRDRSGLAAVEFALILPALIALYLGLNEVQPLFSVQRKVTLVTRTVADLSTRSATLTTDELKNIFQASVAVMRPYGANKETQIMVSSIAITKSGSTYTGKVEWSCIWNPKTGPGANDLTKRVEGSSYDVPSSYQNDTSKSFMLAETRYPYQPTIGFAITGTITMKDQTSWPIRDAERVAKPTCPAQT